MVTTQRISGCRLKIFPKRGSGLGPILIGGDLAGYAERKAKDIGGWNIAKLFVHPGDLRGDRRVLIDEKRDLRRGKSRPRGGRTRQQKIVTANRKRIILPRFVGEA